MIEKPTPTPQTRLLDTTPTEPIRPVRATTGPLDEQLPWVIEFRVVGTPETIQAQVHETMLIGRSDPARGIIPDVDLTPHGALAKGVSRQHAAVLAVDNRILVKDLSSVNGTRLNGQRLAPGQEYRLRHGDELTIGELQLQVRFLVVPTISQASVELPVDHAALPVVGKGQRVLIVEDDEDVAKVFSLALEHAGFRVTVTGTVVAALGYTSQQLPDAVVLDLMLPDMHGLEFLRLIKKQFPDRRLPTVVVSGAAGAHHAAQARDEGVDTFLTKPVSVEDLVRSVAAVMRVTAEAPSS